MSNNELLKSKTKKDYKGFALLEKAFDVVELDLSNKKYNLLVCKDKVKRANCKIDYEVWLNLKIRKNPDFS